MSMRLFELMLWAAGKTVLLSAVSIMIGFAIGLMVCAAKLSPNKLLSIPGRLYVSLFRGVPLLVQLLLIYNLLPALGIMVPSVVAAIAGLSLCTAAYQAENLRGGFQSVPRGLLEAADMVGMSPWKQLTRIRAPIAFRLTLPALVNEAILILKASSLVSVVGVIELTRMAQNLSASSFRPLLFYSVAGGIYLVICWTIAGGGSLAERMLKTESRV
ncbi:MAG: amino acid ABC transporter permease [Fulvimarina manganoxydans]|uniref:amino acid ABC transporter permease n=1 Tax=Fulvimarina manganoxydans TaxID=937218 RepID=UPI00235534FC|nr:amino acid ABC transporter permease [Fulvimarina manganoxydans]MCK5934393.1 amino acid ABC transporter permease [Fulvimarina manganoxydans]MEE2952727.1 amino acid ABC transporter permease [Pseudomonadota bacterium]